MPESRDGYPAEVLDLGFAGLRAAGYTQEEAWAQIRAANADPEVMAVIAEMRTSAEGRAVLDWSRAQWARHGLEPPWGQPDDPAGKDRRT